MDESAFGWIHDDGRHVWFAHDCTEGLTFTMLPYPEFKAGRRQTGTKWITRSVQCEDCGFHNFVKIIDNHQE